MMYRVAAAVIVCALVSTVEVGGAELRPETLRGFEEYVRATEARRNSERGSTFLWVDRQQSDRRADVLRVLRRGEVVIEPLETLDRGRQIVIPAGLVHHWVATAFVPRIRLGEAIAMAQDYDRHAAIFAPAVTRSKILSRDANTFQVYFRFTQKHIITVVLDVFSDASWTNIDPARVEGRVYGHRIVEIENAGTAAERAGQPDDGHGFLWRLNTYCRFAQKDEGVYIEFETLSLTRDVPTGLGWIVRPFVTRVPRESLVFTLAKYVNRLG